MLIQNETLKFKISLRPIFRDEPPRVDILLNQQQYFTGVIDKDQTVEFSVTLQFGLHQLLIRRYGKNISDADGDPNQSLVIEKIEIDDIDVQKLIWAYSKFYPEYPERWASQQKAAGVDLEYPVPGETHLGHNGQWIFEINSPFYKFLISQRQQSIMMI